ncbi:MAG: peptidylprolyl isomerase [Verrucomicrobiales bacterium]|nr:peptidylprolyl isomerase [Verrucomicrobiales bacterium]
MKRFPWRIVLYLVFLLYIFLDLKVCQGPLSQAFSERQSTLEEAAKDQNWVALVNQEPISSDQLRLAVFRHLYQRGKESDAIPERNHEMIRRAVLQSLIDDLLVKQYADGEGFSASDEEISGFIETWEAQFGSLEELEERAELQSLELEERRAELGRIWSRKKWLEKRIAPGIDVTDEEVREWFEANRESGKGFLEPEKIRARIIFLSTVINDDDSREKLIRRIHRQIGEGEGTFEELAEEFSEDLRTKKRGGDMNWFARDRVPDDFGEVVFALEVGALSEPFRTSIGWNLVKIEDRQDERPVSFEEIETEIRHHLENQRTVETIKRLMKKLRTVANIRLFPENL